MQTAYHPAFGQRVPYRFVNLPDSPDGQVRATCREVIRLIRHDAAFSPLVQEDAHTYLKAGQGNAITGVWKLRDKMRFQQDEQTANETDIQDPRIKDTIEVLIRPHDQSKLIRLRDVGIEDCDGYAMYAGCLLWALGIPVALVTVAADPDQPERFSHVYLAAYPEGPPAGEFRWISAMASIPVGSVRISAVFKNGRFGLRRKRVSGVALVPLLP